jgi:LacI family transcriptional regulator
MAEDPSKLTIREVAAAAGVSRMTVTRVMRRDPLVAPKTREAVEEVIRRLGYQPMHAARNLSSTRPRVIGVVSLRTAETEALGLGSEYLTTLHLGALQVCNEANYGLIFFPSHDAESADALVRRVKTRQLSGYVIAAPATETPELMQTLAAHEVPFSAINPADASHCTMGILSDDRQAVRALVEQMVQRGHRRIAFAGAGGHARAHSERLAGYLDAISAAHGGRLRPRVYESSGIAFSDGLAIGRELFSKARRPTAIQCITDDLAAGVIAAAHERRMAMPEALSVSGFDNFGLATRLYPALSTVTLPLMSMAIAATRQVLDTLEGREVVPWQHFGCEVVSRDSIGAPQDD